MKWPFVILTTLLTLPALAGCLPDVEKSFAQINEAVVPLSTWTNDVFKRGSYRQLLKTRFGLDNHIQGIVRVPGTSTFVLSGGDRYIKEANLFFINFNTQETSSALNKNFKGKNSKDASAADGFYLKLDIGSKDYWHAGGLAIIDRTLIVPVENPKTKMSKIIFFDLTDPAHPEKLAVEIIRTDSTTGSVLVYQTPEEKIMVVGNVDGRMEFFESQTKDIRDGFTSKKIIGTEVQGQGTDIVHQCDGKLFIMDFNNTGKFAPIINGKDIVSLYQLDVEKGEATFITKRHLTSKGYCNFKAAGSHYVSEDGKLVLYGSSFYRNFSGKQFKLCQFSE